jgi:hypothetical protein
MSPSTLPRTLASRVGATAALAALTASGALWLAAPDAAVGEGGDIRVHREGVPYTVSKEDPVVCRFYLDAANFDTATVVAYTITPQPPLSTSATVSGTITLAAGAGHTDVLGLADGQYKITWVPNVPAVPPVPPPGTKEKVFRVNCHDEKHDEKKGGNEKAEDPGHGSATIGNDHGEGPKGGVHAGGGGLARATEAFSPATATAAVGLVVLSGFAYVRLVRRRPDGAA